MVIPKTFWPQQKKYLTPPWEDFRFESDYASDLILNFIAFVILGFLTVASYSYFSLKRTLLFIIAVLNSFLISITIETLQVFLPSRTSQLSDLLLNTLGGYSGGVLYYYVASFIKKLPEHVVNIKNQ
jgi:glycopeptide antibiotics resistance protein